MSHPKVSMSELVAEYAGNCAHKAQAIHRAADAISIGAFAGGRFAATASPADFVELAAFIDYAKAEFALAGVTKRDARRDDVQTSFYGTRLVLSGELVE